MKNEKKLPVGLRLKELRSRQGLSPTDVALAIGVPISTYREWENGRAIRGEPYCLLAKVLQVSLHELMMDESDDISKILHEFSELEVRFKKFKETLYSSI